MKKENAKQKIELLKKMNMNKKTIDSSNIQHISVNGEDIVIIANQNPSLERKMAVVPKGYYMDIVDEIKENNNDFKQKIKNYFEYNPNGKKLVYFMKEEDYNNIKELNIVTPLEDLEIKFFMIEDGTDYASTKESKTYYFQI